MITPLVGGHVGRADVEVGRSRVRRSDLAMHVLTYGTAVVAIVVVTLLSGLH